MPATKKMPSTVIQQMLQHACISESLPAVCVHFGTWQVRISVCQHTVLGKARLIVDFIQMDRRWGLAKDHLT